MTSHPDDLLPEYQLEHLRAALATDERINALDLELRLHAEELTLVGCVTTHDRRRAVETIARQFFPRHTILNEIDVAALDGSSLHEASTSTVRIAAVGDIHLGTDSQGQLRKHLDGIDSQADLLLLAGDLTRHGTEDEALVLAAEIRDMPVPVVAVLGNHDYHSNQVEGITKILADVGVIVLEKSGCVIDVHGASVGIAGAKGFGGGFIGACGSDFGEPLMKDFIGETRAAAESLRNTLESFSTDLRVALMHFSPVEDTLRGERLEIYPWLGSYLLAEAVDAAGCDFVFHGHAHAGSELGLTAGGVPVRNVAQPLLGQAYKVYCLNPDVAVSGVTALEAIA